MLIIKARYLAAFILVLNSINGSIQFTVEEEKEGKLAFLDISINRNEDGTFEYGIYRKPIHTDRYIPSDSHHCGQHQQAAFHTMVHRLLTIPMSKQKFEEEKNYIKDVAYKNGYNENFINKIFKKHERNIDRENYTTLATIEEGKKRISVPFYPKFINKLNDIFKRYNIEIVCNSSNNIKQQLVNVKDKVPELQQSGIYAIPCSDCDSIYIGQTRRRIEARISEHHGAHINGKIEKSGVAEHAIESQHNINYNGTKMIKNIRNNNKLDAWESMLIHNSEYPLMNKEDAPLSSPLFDWYGSRIS